MTKADRYGVVHYVNTDGSIFTRCTLRNDAPSLTAVVDEHGADGVVTCLTCLVRNPRFPEILDDEG